MPLTALCQLGCIDSVCRKRIKKGIGDALCLLPLVHPDRAAGSAGCT